MFGNGENGRTPATVMPKVEDYLAFCAERGEEPEKPFSGKISVRIDPELHRQITLQARLANKSLNSWVNERLQEAVVT